VSLRKHHQKEPPPVLYQLADDETARDTSRGLREQWGAAETLDKALEKNAWVLGVRALRRVVNSAAGKVRSKPKTRKLLRRSYTTWGGVCLLLAAILPGAWFSCVRVEVRRDYADRVMAHTGWFGNAAPLDTGLHEQHLIRRQRQSLYGRPHLSWFWQSPRDRVLEQSWFLRAIEEPHQSFMLVVFGGDGLPVGLSRLQDGLDRGKPEEQRHCAGYLQCIILADPPGLGPLTWGDHPAWVMLNHDDPRIQVMPLDAVGRLARLFPEPREGSVKLIGRALQDDQHPEVRRAAVTAFCELYRAEQAWRTEMPEAWAGVDSREGMVAQIQAEVSDGKRRVRVSGALMCLLLLELDPSAEARLSRTTRGNLGVYRRIAQGTMRRLARFIRSSRPSPKEEPVKAALPDFSRLCSCDPGERRKAQEDLAQSLRRRAEELPSGSRSQFLLDHLHGRARTLVPGAGATTHYVYREAICVASADYLASDDPDRSSLLAELRKFRDGNGPPHLRLAAWDTFAKAAQRSQ
jgi:hypothetical protein